MPALIERPKMSLAMWAALKVHIMRQREKKKQEQEADAAIERLRREQEQKRKQDAMTLEEIKDQLSHMEQKLGDLKEEKHQLFLQLKKVLHEDETRRRALVKETKYLNSTFQTFFPNNSDMVSTSHAYPPQSLHIGTAPVYLPASGPLITHGSTMYKVAGPPSQPTMLPPGALKRPRSPSPPPAAGYQQNYNYKTQVTTYGQKPSLYTPNQTPNAAFYPHNTSQTPGTPVTASNAVTAGPSPASYPAYAGAPPPPGQYAPSPDQSVGTKHLAPSGFHLTHIQQPGYVGPLQPQLEHTPPKPPYTEEKYYVQQPATVVSIQGVGPIAAGQSVIPIQQQTKPGGITSGYPVRSQPPAPPTSAQPPPSHTNYNSQPALPPRLPYTSHPTSSYY